MVGSWTSISAKTRSAEAASTLEIESVDPSLTAVKNTASPSQAAVQNIVLTTAIATVAVGPDSDVTVTAIQTLDALPVALRQSQGRPFICRGDQMTSPLNP